MNGAESASWTVLLLDTIRKVTHLVSKSLRNAALCSRIHLLPFLIDWISHIDSRRKELSETILDLIAELGTFSIGMNDVKAMMGMLRSEVGDFRPARSPALLTVLQRMADETDGAQMFFDFDGAVSGLILSNIEKWPVNRGYTFACWLRIESFGVGGLTHEPRLFSFLTASGSGLECMFTGTAQHRLKLVTLAGSGGRAHAVTFTHGFEPKQWYHVAITHTYRLIGSSDACLYVNGVRRDAQSLKYPSPNGTLTSCAIGTNGDGRSTTLAMGQRIASLSGQLGPSALFSEVIGTEAISQIYQLGPDHVSCFLPADAADYPAADKNWFDGKSLSPKLMMAWHAGAVDGSEAVDTTATVRGGNPLPARLAQGTLALESHHLRSVLSCVGGVQVLYPLFSQLDMPVRRAEGIDYVLNGALCSQLLSLLACVLRHSPENQQDMMRTHGFSIIAFLLQQTSPQHLSHSLSLDSLGRINNAVYSDSLRRELFDAILFNFRLWIYTDVTVQERLLRALGTYIQKRSDFFRRTLGVQRIVDVMRTYYWSTQERESLCVDPIVHPVTGAVLGARPSDDGVSALRGLLYDLLKIIITPGGVRTGEVSALVAYMIDCRDDAQVADVALFLTALVRSDSSALACLISPETAGLPTLYAALEHDGENTRMVVLQLVATVMRLGMTKHRRQVTRDFHPELILRRLQPYPLTTTTYCALFELMTGQFHDGPDARQLDGTERLLVSRSGLARVIFSLLASPSCSSELRMRALQEFTILLGHSPDSVEAFQSETGWQGWLLNVLAAESARLRDEAQPQAQPKKHREEDLLAVESDEDEPPIAQPIVVTAEATVVGDMVANLLRVVLSFGMRQPGGASLLEDTVAAIRLYGECDALPDATGLLRALLLSLARDTPTGASMGPVLEPPHLSEAFAALAALIEEFVLYGTTTPTSVDTQQVSPHQSVSAGRSSPGVGVFGRVGEAASGVASALFSGVGRVVLGGSTPLPPDDVSAIQVDPNALDGWAHASLHLSGGGIPEAHPAVVSVHRDASGRWLDGDLVNTLLARLTECFVSNVDETVAAAFEHKAPLAPDGAVEGRHQQISDGPNWFKGLGAGLGMALRLTLLGIREGDPIRRMDTVVERRQHIRTLRLILDGKAAEARAVFDGTAMLDFMKSRLNQREAELKDRDAGLFEHMTRLGRIIDCDQKLHNDPPAHRRLVGLLGFLLNTVDSSLQADDTTHEFVAPIVRDLIRQHRGYLQSQFLDPRAAGLRIGDDAWLLSSQPLYLFLQGLQCDTWRSAFGDKGGRPTPDAILSSIANPLHTSLKHTSDRMRMVALWRHAYHSLIQSLTSAEASDQGPSRLCQREANRRATASLAREESVREGTRHWLRVTRELSSARGPFARRVDRSRYKLDMTEDRGRRRRKLRRDFDTPNRTVSATSAPESVVADEALPIVPSGVRAAGDRGGDDTAGADALDDTAGGEDAEWSLVAPSEANASTPGDPGGANPSGFAATPLTALGRVLFGSTDTAVQFSSNCELVSPMLVLPGRFEITSEHMHFVVDRSGAAQQEDPWTRQAMKTAPHRKWVLSAVRDIFLRRYLLRPNAIEIFMHEATILLNFANDRIRRRAWRAISNAKPPHLETRGPLSPAEMFKRSRITERWQRYELSNFDYLMALNTLAGRTYNDITQYPVYPWILTDYSSTKLDLADPNVYRDLSQPIGALGPASRKEAFQQRYDDWEDPSGEVPKFHYGTHYSTPGSVLFYLLRMEPFTSQHLQLQSGRFDHPDRLFHGIDSAFQSVITSSADVKELVPEFFYQPEFLENFAKLGLGRKQNGEIVDDVILPPWAKSPEDFVRANREALESPLVSAHLHHWIDLIFGWKQRGPAAADAINVFYFLTYEGAVDLDAITDPVQRAATEAQIANFGQCPSQLLTKPHPPRGSPPFPPQYRISTPPDMRRVWFVRMHAAVEEAIVFVAAVPEAAFKSGSVDGDGTCAPLAPTGVHVLITVSESRVLGVHRFTPGAPPTPGRSAAPIVALDIDRTLARNTQLAEEVERLRGIQRKLTQLQRMEGGSEPPPLIDVRRKAPVRQSAEVVRLREALLTSQSTAAALREQMEKATRSFKLLPMAFTVPTSRLLAVTHGGRGLALGGLADGSAKCISAETCQVVSTLAKHREPISCLAFTHDGATLATGGSEGLVRVWDIDQREIETRGKHSGSIATRELRHTLAGHDGPITGVAVSSEFDALVSASTDGTLIVSTLRRGEFVRSIEVQKSRIGLLAMSSQAHIATYCPDGQYLSVHSINGKRLARVCAEESLSCLGFSCDGEWLLTAGDSSVMARSVYDLQIVHVWERLVSSARSMHVLFDFVIVGLANGELLVGAVDLEGWKMSRAVAF